MPEQPTKGTAPLYVEMPADLRQRLDAFVKRTRRTLKGEISNAIEQYLDREEGVTPRSQPEPPTPPAKKRKEK